MFQYKKLARQRDGAIQVGYEVYQRSSGLLLGIVIRIGPIRGHPWAKFLLDGDHSIYGNWFADRDEAAFELFTRWKKKLFTE